MSERDGDERPWVDPQEDLARSYAEAAVVSPTPTDAEQIVQLRERVAQLTAALDRDRTGLGAALNRIRQTTQAYAWIPAGEWGAYDYAQRDCATLRREIGQCLEEIYTTAVQALQASGVQATQTLLNLKVDHVP